MSVCCNLSIAAFSPNSQARRRLPAIHYLNNRAENSHQPTRQRERRIKRFKSP
jgi:transposase-like protein